MITTVEAVAQLLVRAERVAVLTGAGVSAESGIPTFRDAMTGMWSRFDPFELASPEGFARQPAMVWNWYAERRASVGKAKPNPGHFALAEIERRVRHFTLITQNVDGLHQEAGSRRVIELHGNIRRVKCSRDGGVKDGWTEDGEVPPRCSECGGYLRPDVVWFGELLPARALQEAGSASLDCDLFFSIGTSNLVEPAASLPWTAHRHGAKVVVVNPTDEGQRRGPGIEYLLGNSGEILAQVVNAAWHKTSEATHS